MKLISSDKTLIFLKRKEGKAKHFPEECNIAFQVVVMFQITILSYQSSELFTTLPRNIKVLKN